MAKLGVERYDGQFLVSDEVIETVTLADAFSPQITETVGFGTVKIHFSPKAMYRLNLMNLGSKNGSFLMMFDECLEKEIVTVVSCWVGMEYIKVIRGKNPMMWPAGTKLRYLGDG